METEKYGRKKEKMMKNLFYIVVNKEVDQSFVGLDFVILSKGRYFFFNGTADAFSYIKHLRNNFLPWYTEQNFKPIYFQHDNAPPHVSRATKNSLAEWGLDVIKWPANSPDLNPVENVWKLLSDRVYASGKQYNSKKQLEKAIREAYEELDPTQLENLIKSMEKRLALVLLKQGGKVKY